MESYIVAVGGSKTDEELCTEFRTKVEAYTPPMPTVRCLPGVVSLQSSMIVVGGYSAKGDTNAVEIFNTSTLQWYKTNPLPMICREVSLATIDNTCYAVGGYRFPFRLNQALYASISDLLGNAVPANQTITHYSSSSDAQSAWKTLPNTPAYRPAAAVLVGSLLAHCRRWRKFNWRSWLIEKKCTCTLPPPTPGSTSATYLLHDRELLCHQQRF